MGVWDVGNFFGPRPPERRKTPLMQDRIKILFIIDFTFWTLFASHNYCISLSLEETALNPHLALRYKSRMTTTDQWIVSERNEQQPLWRKNWPPPPILFSSNLDELENRSSKKWGGHVHPSPPRGAAPGIDEATFEIIILQQQHIELLSTQYSFVEWFRNQSNLSWSWDRISGC